MEMITSAKLQTSYWTNCCLERDEQIVIVSQVNLDYTIMHMFNVTSVSDDYVVNTCCLLNLVKVLVADINIGYENIFNTQVSGKC